MKRILKIMFVLSLPLFFCAIGSAAVLFEDNFDNGASPLWGNERGGWTVLNGGYHATYDNWPADSYSSLPYDLTDFSIDVDVKHATDNGIWLRSSHVGGGDNTGVLLIIGGGYSGETGLYWHTCQNGSYSGPLATINNLFTPGDDIHLKIVVQGDTYQAFFNGSTTPATTLTCHDYSSGKVALYDCTRVANSTTDTFDNFTLSTVPEPSTFVLLGMGLLGLAAYIGKRRKLAK